MKFFLHQVDNLEISSNSLNAQKLWISIFPIKNDIFY
jgi:hypothetical protein